jgi:hypothetical protein
MIQRIGIEGLAQDRPVATKVTKTRPFAGTVVVLVMRSFQLGALPPKTTAIGGGRGRWSRQ